MKKKKVYSEAQLQKILKYLAQQIYEANQGETYCLIGIVTNGYPIAVRIGAFIKELYKKDIPVGKLDVSLYRDDLSLQGKYITVKESDIPFDINENKVILVDDVIFRGRTIRAAMDGLMDFGRPSCIQLAVLIDRGWREFPIQPDFVGEKLKTKKDETVMVELSEEEGADRITIIQQ